MVEWHHLLNGHESDSERQGSLACCSPWSGKELDMTQWLNNIKCFQGFPGGSVVKESACQGKSQRRCWLNPWVRKIPWSRKMATHSSILAKKIP